jgi:hypothetical protein
MKENNDNANDNFIEIDVSNETNREISIVKNFNEVSDEKYDDEEITSSEVALRDYLKEVDDTKIEYINIDKKLFGVLDFSILNVNHHNVNHIFIGEGNITEILNLPQSLKKLECSNNLLSSLSNLPQGIVEVNVSHNMITKLDLKQLSKLQKLNCSWNRLNTLNDIPDSITDINVNNNNIVEIDLSGLDYLESLDCANNTGITLKNVPPGIELNIDMKGGATNIEDEDNENKYEDVLNKYFKLKSEYTNNAYNIRNNYYKGVLKNKKTSKTIPLPTCVRCKKKGGTIFSKKKDIYYAVCGNKNICFEIEIDTKSKTIRNIEESMNQSKTIVESRKDEIIKHKMDTLFGYINKEESSNVFIKKVEKYAIDTAKYEECLNKYNNVFHNLEKDELIQSNERAINELIEEINVTNLKLSHDVNNRIIIHDLVELQIKVANMSKEVMKIKYETNEVSIKIDEKDDNIKKSKVVQSIVKFQNKFCNGDKPQVLQFKFFPY